MNVNNIGCSTNCLNMNLYVLLRHALVDGVRTPFVFFGTTGDWKFHAQVFRLFRSHPASHIWLLGLVILQPIDHVLLLSCNTWLCLGLALGRATRRP